MKKEKRKKNRETQREILFSDFNFYGGSRKRPFEQIRGNSDELPCDHVSIPIPHIHRGAQCRSEHISDRTIAADSVLSNYVGGGAALATFGITLLTVCKSSFCFALGIFNLILTSLFLFVSVLHYFWSVDSFHRSHSYLGNRLAALLIILQAVAVLALVVAQFSENSI